MAVQVKECHTISQLMRALGRAVHDLQHSRSVVSDKALNHSSRAVNRVLHSAHVLTIMKCNLYQ